MIDSTLGITTFPEEGLLSDQEIAERLTMALLEDDRKLAFALLADEILPISLKGLSDHPKPSKMQRLVFKDIANQLMDIKPEMRLDLIKEKAQEAEIKQLKFNSLCIAIAVYLNEFPKNRKKAFKSGWKSYISNKNFAKKTPVELSDISKKELEKLEAWKEKTQKSYPTIWASYRPNYLIVQSNLGAAVNKNFTIATGSLYDFLRGMGVKVNSLNVH